MRGEKGFHGRMNDRVFGIKRLTPGRISHQNNHKKAEIPPPYSLKYLSHSLNFLSLSQALIFHLFKPMKRGAPCRPASSLLLLCATRIPGRPFWDRSESLVPAGDAASPASRGIPQDARVQHRRPGGGRQTIPACPTGQMGCEKRAGHRDRRRENRSWEGRNLKYESRK
jgi:hypothetical protein